ncbi:phospholipase D-like domain-containing protein [Denitromonas iodatirespirans]|uniref:PLD phosphodiesterase domain-containing protein n=1 Tax=Denitromonas iodatirespirans TaxID=2795389 RepID=A0A944HFP5_DENI1|nr:phospholipase D-like domain-containing protein [Denitromonas iodatirespirans]MBT0963896.1 hypothetical protein [Denitromonas iodatirespirans]
MAQATGRRTMALTDTTAHADIALNSQREVRLTMPWFAENSKYPPRPTNLIEPLVNGERAFAAVHEAIANARTSIDIISWGFDPSMRLIRPGGERLGDLLRRKADKFARNDGTFLEPSVPVRILIWKNAIANMGENNIIGDGLIGSGGGTALGSGVGGLESAGGGAATDDGFNAYGDNHLNSAAVRALDDEARAFNRAWFRYQPLDMEFRTRDFSFYDRAAIADQQRAQSGMAGASRTGALAAFASHHQKVILIDYESPDDAIGFVMGHNLLRNYWDTDSHEYQSTVRDGFAPWQDLSCRVRGPVLFDLNENFMTAWDRADTGRNKMSWSEARRARRAEDFIAPAQRRGGATLAQICRTQPQENDKGILAAYRLALANARNYVYFENQYFRYRQFAELLRTTRRRLKAAGWRRDFHIFVVTNTPDDHGRVNTYDMLAALGQGQMMPAMHKNASGQRDPDSALRTADLEGVNIHVCTLLASGRGGQYKNIYVHSKLLLVDDVFFTLGSANINTRSMETDSELNIAAPAPALTRQWREHLWRIHTGAAPGEDMETEFDRWERMIKANASDRKLGAALAAPLVEFFDNEDAWLAPD